MTQDFSHICFVSRHNPLTRKMCFTIVKQSLLYQKCVYNVQTMVVCVCWTNVSGNRSESDCRSRGREFGPARSHTFVEIDHEIISTVILLLPLNHSRRVVVSYKRKYVHEVLVNCLFKLAQEKVWLGELTVSP